jgi:hypothetical protein
MGIRAGALALGLAMGWTGCASSGAGADPAGLSLTAYAAWGEARSQARGWASDAELQYVEGASVTNEGTVRSDAGYWRFVYASDSRAQQLAVTVTPTSVDSEERTPQGPPGFVLGDATLGSDWIDSPQVVDAVPSFGGDTRVQMFLVPTTPPRWIIGDIEIDARSGAVLD